MKQPYPLQAAAIEAMTRAYLRGDSGPLAVMPTGSGKTLVLCWTIARLLLEEAVGRVLVTTWRVRLITQIAETFQSELPWVRVAILGRDDPDWIAGAQVVLGTTGVVCASGAAQLWDYPVELTVFDEAHHAVAPSWRQALTLSGARRVMGFTATPLRHDDIRLGKLFTHVAAYCTTQQLTKAGRLVPYTTIRDDAEALLGRWARENSSRQTILYCERVDQADYFAEGLTKLGHPARAIHDETHPDDEEEAIRLYKLGRVRVLVNVYKLSEGVDLPSTSCILILRNVQSMPMLWQMVGRGLRLAPDKEDCVVYAPFTVGTQAVLDPRLLYDDATVVNRMGWTNALAPYSNESGGYEVRELWESGLRGARGGRGY